MWLTHKIISHFIDGHASTPHVSVYFQRVTLNFFRKRKKHPRHLLFFAQTKSASEQGTWLNWWLLFLSQYSF